MATHGEIDSCRLDNVARILKRLNGRIELIAGRSRSRMLFLYSAQNI